MDRLFGIKFLGLILLLGSFSALEETSARLIFTQEAGVELDTFTIDFGDNSQDFIDLEFGTALGAKITFDTLNDKFLVNKNFDLTDNQALNFRVENLAAAPTCDGTVTGKTYFNTADTNMYVCNGSLWEQLDAVGGGVGVASVFYAYDGTGGQVVDGTEITLNLDTPEVVDPNYSLMADEVTITNAGLYKIHLDSGYTETNTTGGQRTSIEVRLQEDGVDIPGAFSDCYLRETEETSCAMTILHQVAAGGIIRARIQRTGGTTNVETLSDASRLIIERIR